MSEIGGIYSFDSSPIDPAPVLAWDGRLDNRADLLRDLAEGLNGDRTDAALVMAAYQRWGDAFLSKLVGDFVLSLFCPSLKTVYLARDPFGTRTLYYCVTHNRLVWSSTLRGILSSGRIDPQVDDEYIAGYLALHPEMSRSPYRNVSAVEPGHLVVITPRSIERRRFWVPEPERDIRYTKDSEYEDQFLELFRDAVRCRLQTNQPVWAELSGGLDSSSIVCIADQILERGEASAPRLETVSYIDRESGPSNDNEFIKAVEKQRGRLGHHLERKTNWVRFVVPEESFPARPSTRLCVAGSYEWLSEKMRNDGANVLLSGLGGDQVLCSVPQASPFLADLLYQLKPVQLHRELRMWSRLLKRPYAQLLWKETILPFLPELLKSRFESTITVAPWLDRRFVKQMRLRDRMRLPADPFHIKPPSKAMQMRRLMFVICDIAQGECWETRSFNKTYPFLHRPLVEFLLAIPLDQKLRGIETRSLMRRALKGVLPERVRLRRGKGTTGETFCRGLAHEWSSLKPMLADARVYHFGYVDRAGFPWALDLARHGYSEDIMTVLKIISLEIWLRSLEFWRPAFAKPDSASSQVLTVADALAT